MSGREGPGLATMFFGFRIGQLSLAARSYGPQFGVFAIVMLGGTAEASHGSSMGARASAKGGVNGIGRFFPAWHPSPAIPDRKAAAIITMSGLRLPSDMKRAYPEKIELSMRGDGKST